MFVGRFAGDAMMSVMRSPSIVFGFVRDVFGILIDGLLLCRLCLRSPAALAAENLFLRKQLSLYVERKTKPRRATDAVRFTLAQLSRFFDWRDLLTVVKPDTLIRWHRKGFRFFLEMEISAHRASANSRQCSGIDH